MITAHIERLADTLEELKPLFVPHYAELALDQDKAPLDPQYELYLAREAAGEVLLATVRDRGALCAYFVGFVAPAMHYRTTLTLTMDIFWVAPEYRQGDSLESLERDMVAGALFEAVEREGRRRGVKRVYYGTKSHRWAGETFARMGMRETDTYYSAWWGES